MNAHSLPRIVGTKDDMERIADLMADGRERTLNDVAVKLGIGIPNAQHYLRRLSDLGRVKATQWRNGYEFESIWRVVK